MKINAAPSIRMCEYWFGRFKSGDTNVDDEERSGQPESLKMQICKHYWTKIQHNSLPNLLEHYKR